MYQVGALLHDNKENCIGQLEKCEHWISDDIKEFMLVGER